jgi:hypothetical protein
MTASVAGAALACAASIAQAQPGFVDLAAFPAKLVVTPAITLSDVGVDTNILAAEDDPKNDVTANLRLQLGAAAPLGRARIRGSGAAALAYFQQYAAQRSVDAEGNLGLALPLNRFTLHAAGGALRTRDEFGPEIEMRVRRVESRLDAGSSVRLTGKTSIATSLSRSRIAFNANEIRFDRSLRQALDRNVDRLSIAARTALTPLTSVVAVIEVERDRFQFSPLRDANGARALGGVEFKPTALLAGKAQVGYRRFVSRDAVAPDVAGAVASIDVAYTFSDAMRVAARMERDLAHSYSLEERYYLSTDIQISITRRVSRAWDITARSGRLQLDYRGAVAPNLNPSPIDRQVAYGAGVEYRLGDAMSIGLNGDYYHRRSQLTVREYDRLRVVSALDYRF